MTALKLKTDKALKEMANCLHEQIYTFDCFGTKDLMYYEMICNELEERGYNIEEDKILSITK